MRRFNVPSYNCRAGDVVPRRHNDRIRRLQKSKQWFEIAVGDESGGAFESGHGASSKQTKNVRVYRRKYGKIAEPQNHFPTVKISYESCITLARPFYKRRAGPYTRIDLFLRDAVVAANGFIS